MNKSSITNREGVFLKKLKKLKKLLSDYDVAMSTANGNDNVEMLLGERSVIERHYVDADDIEKILSEVTVKDTA